MCVCVVGISIGESELGLTSSLLGIWIATEESSSKEDGKSWMDKGLGSSSAHEYVCM